MIVRIGWRLEVVCFSGSLDFCLPALSENGAHGVRTDALETLLRLAIRS